MSHKVCGVLFAFADGSRQVKEYESYQAMRDDARRMKTQGAKPKAWWFDDGEAKWDD